MFFWMAVTGPMNCEAISCNTVEPLPFLTALTAYKTQSVENIGNSLKIQL